MGQGLFFLIDVESGASRGLPAGRDDGQRPLVSGAPVPAEDRRLVGRVDVAALEVVVVMLARSGSR